MVDHPATPARRGAPAGKPAGPAKAPARAATPKAPAKATASKAASSKAAPAKGSAKDTSHKTTTQKKTSKPKKKPWKSLSRRQKAGKLTLWAAIGLVGLLLAGLLAGFIYYQTTELPDPNADFDTSTTTLYYRDGTTQLGRLAIQNRTPLDYAEMPQNIKDAVVAAEDRTFWTNRGISVPGMIRAAWRVAWGGDLQSGSTLTQQYVKTRYLTNDQTLSRKMKELVLSMKMTNTMSKEQILEGYLNTVYFGRGAYGIEAAAKAFFNIGASDLTVPQAAVLTSLLRGPSLYDPADADNLPRLTERYNYVLDSMVTMGTLTQEEADQYKDKLPEFPEIPTSQRYGGPTGFLMNMVENELQRQGFTAAQVTGGGYSITTTFDADAQAAAVAAAQKYTQMAADKARQQPQDPSQLHAALASVAVSTGEVLALYGGPDFVDNSRNWATTPRMTGSTFKPYAFIAGERNGASLNTMLAGNPITIGDDTISNDGGARYGSVSLLKATENSINTAFVDLVQQIPDGPEKVIQAAEDAGLTPNSTWQAVAGIPLGTAEVSPLGMASAYATFANSGVAVAPHVVMEVKDRSGNIIYSARPDVKQAVEPDICRDLTYALQSVVDLGTGTAARALGYPAAGKTGTATLGDGVGASWFIGYTKQISTAVMYVAGPQGISDLNPYAPPSRRAFHGGVYPAETWVDYMKVAMNGLPKMPFDPPAYVNAAQPSVTPTPGEVPTDEPTDEATSAPAPLSASPTGSAPPTSAPPTTHSTTTPPTTHSTTAPPTTAPPTSAPPPPSGTG